MKKKVRHGLKALSRARQAKLERFWNKNLKDPLAFIPKEEKAKGLDPTEARKRNEDFGKFADSYMKKLISRITNDSDISRRMTDDMKIMAVGYGLGYGSRWLGKATQAGFQTWWIDVSSVVWMWAKVNLENQFHDTPQSTSPLYKEPIVQTAEIQSLLAEPNEVELDLASVEIWYLCRLLNCLSTRSAKIVLQEIGRTALGSGSHSSKRGAVVIINALSDENPEPANACVGMSIRRSKKMILANLSRGAGCQVEPRYTEHYMYFDQIYTAMTVMVKR